MKLKNFAKNIWTIERPFKMYGLPLGNRMTIVDYSGNGDLWLHSPVSFTDDVEECLSNLGTVRYVVAPNRWHHLAVGDYIENYPDTQFICAPGLDEKRPDLKFDGVIGDQGSYPWSSVLSHQVIEGSPILNEVVFYHEPSQTLVVTDVGIHICEDSPLLTRLVFKLIGGYRHFGWTAVEKIFLIKNKKAFNSSIDKVLKWDFDKIILSHGQPVLGDGKAVFKKAFG
ncbi:DUF4336 domain-containing protein [Oligoflexaceae bacterium]|nr:DUF4336 domain-containing protein [Oligoflexaceae bacterium]